MAWSRLEARFHTELADAPTADVLNHRSLHERRRLVRTLPAGAASEECTHQSYAIDPRGHRTYCVWRLSSVAFAVLLAAALAAALALLV